MMGMIHTANTRKKSAAPSVVIFNRSEHQCNQVQHCNMTFQRAVSQLFPG